MISNHHKPEAIARGARMLRTALGPAIARYLEDPGVVEVMLNPDGRIWIDRLSEGLIDTGATMSAADGERIVRLIVLPLMKCSRRIRAIVSTTSISHHLLRYKAGSATDQPSGGQFWTPIPRLRGAILQAE